MKYLDLLPSLLIGAVASARSMSPMAALAGVHLIGRTTPGRLILLKQPVFTAGALTMGVGELFGDKMKTAPDRTVALGLIARILSAGIAGAALAPNGSERIGGAIAVATAVPLAYLSLATRRRAMKRIGQMRSGLVEDAMVICCAVSVVSWASRKS